MIKIDAGQGVHFGITDRAGGVSLPPYDTLNLGGRVGDVPDLVEENWRRVARSIGLPRDRLVGMAQVHGSAVAVATERPARPPTVDGLVTDAPGLALIALGADCAPVMLADPELGLIGAAHCGRPGLVRGILPAIVARLGSLGARSLIGYVGPAICGRCYEVPVAMRDEVADVVPAAAATTQWGSPGLDIGAGAAAELRALGVDVIGIGRCTYEGLDLYSHRRDGVTGRHAGVVWRNASPD